MEPSCGAQHKHHNHHYKHMIPISNTIGSYRFANVYWMMAQKERTTTNINNKPYRRRAVFAVWCFKCLASCGTICEHIIQTNRRYIYDGMNFFTWTDTINHTSSSVVYCIKKRDYAGSIYIYIVYVWNELITKASFFLNVYASQPQTLNNNKH